jgi:hypothetical protein
MLARDPPEGLKIQATSANPPPMFSHKRLSFEAPPIWHCAFVRCATQLATDGFLTRAIAPMRWNAIQYPTMTDDFSVERSQPTEAFDPLFLDEAVIAMPLLEQMQGEREAEARALEEAKKAISVESDEVVAAIELNAISLKVAF